MIFGFASLALLTAAVASIFVREDEAPVARREAASEAGALEQLRAVNERLERLEHTLGHAVDEDVTRGGPGSTRAPE